MAIYPDCLTCIICGTLFQCARERDSSLEIGLVRRLGKHGEESIDILPYLEVGLPKKIDPKKGMDGIGRA